VKASAGVWPVFSRSFDCEVKIVEATATPIAPPICWFVLISPEASPASRSETWANAAIVTGTKAKASPSAKVMYAGKRSGQ
jgi:hypothetical protein